MIAGHPIEKEEDVLFIKNLPDFDGRISEMDSELLLSYLTAPYIRSACLLFAPCPSFLSCLFLVLPWIPPGVVSPLVSDAGDSGMPCSLSAVGSS